jgi:GTP-binding protein
MALHKVVIVGRPNVGKSSLFNLLAKKRKAVTAPTPGVTVDRVEEEIVWGNKRVILTDTGGMGKNETVLDKEIQNQVNKAIEESDLCLFMVDVRDGIHPIDKEIHSMLKRLNKPYLTVVNKVDSSKLEAGVASFYELGVERLYAVSAIQRKGIHDLMEAIFSYIGTEDDHPTQDKRLIPTAIVGRPNVGKSSLLNRILGEERVIVSEIPGTTRDAIAETFSYKGRQFTVIDTAGLRRKSRVDSPLEAYSISRTIETIKKAHICVLLIDACEGPTTQDQKISALIQREKRVCIIALSKADLIPNENRERLETILELKFRFLPSPTILYTSASTGEGIGDLLERVIALEDKYTAQVPTSRFNEALLEVSNRYSQILEGKKIKVYYGTQTSTAPPHFILFTNTSRRVPSSYQRYLERKLAQTLGLAGVPVKITFKPRR